MNLFIDKHHEFLQLLIKAKVDFLLIGGYAVISYGYKRTTGDMDVWLRPDNANKMKLLPVLEGMGFDKKGIKTIEAFNFEKPNMFFFYQVPERIDCLTHISGVSFNEAFDQKIITETDGLEVPFISLKHLILTKISTDRSKDKADIDELQKIEALRNKKK